jgi:predicted outer membrane repeat protein
MLKAILLLACINSIGVPGISIALCQAHEAPWPMFCHDPQHTARSRYVGPDVPSRKWMIATEGPVISSPVVSAEGTVYVGSGDGRLWAVNSDGSLRWSYMTGSSIRSSPSISVYGGTIYIGSDDDSLYAINPDGSLKWVFATEGDVVSSPTVATDGTIYVGSDDGKLYALYPDGSLKWSYPTGGQIWYSSPALGNEGTIYVGSHDHQLYAFNPDGSLKWSYATNGPVASSPTIGGDETVYVGSEDCKLYTLKPDGSLKWSFRTGNTIRSSPALDFDGTVYVGSYDGKLYAFNPDGSLRWSYRTDQVMFSSPAIGKDGTIYVGTTGRKLYAINPDGSLRWYYATDDQILSSPAIGSDGTIYIGSNDQRLYAIYSGTGGMVRRVPSEYETIQAAIDVAYDWDTVLVADGVYTGDGNRDMDFKGKTIVVMSENGPEATIIDCGGSSRDPHRGFYFHRDEDEGAVLEGFTIKNGYVTDSRGGGILCWEASPTIKNNNITGNTASESSGGGIYCLRHYGYIMDNAINANTAWKYGGGICCNNCWVFVEGNEVRGNKAEVGGGIVFLGAGGKVVKENTIIGNSAGNMGGWSGVGGGIYLGFAVGNHIEGNIICRNTATSYGGGIYCLEECSPYIKGNTFAENKAEVGGGIYCSRSCFPKILNSIFWADSASSGREIAFGETCSLEVIYCDIQGGWEGEGNIEADPLFVLSDHKDYRLLWRSPCIDSGDPDFYDPDGSRSDMGKFYFDQTDSFTVYVTPDKSVFIPGDTLEVTYTLINRWPESGSFWIRSIVHLPWGGSKVVMEPELHELDPETTDQFSVLHAVHKKAPSGWYEYRCKIGIPPHTLFDQDYFFSKIK